jgi:hypothetical protein
MNKRLRLTFGLLAILLLGGASRERVVQVSPTCTCTFTSIWNCEPAYYMKNLLSRPPNERDVSCRGICWPDQLDVPQAEDAFEKDEVRQ